MAFNLMNKASELTLKEGEFTKNLESRTAKVPSSTYLAVALGAMALSAGLEVFTQRKQLATFIGLWTPSILIMGLYNKLVKVGGHD